MTSITAQNILDENGYTTSDISLINCERLIDNAIDYINLMSDRNISNLAGTEGSKTVNVNSEEAPIIKFLAGLLVRAYKDKGPNTAISGLSVTTLIQDPQYDLLKGAVEKGIQRLREIQVSYG